MTFTYFEILLNVTLCCFVYNEENMNLDFILDALSLGNEDSEGYRLNAIRSLRTSFWISLGTSDEEREKKKFNYLLEQKTFYCGQIRTCIAEAL
ncbi:unnamed protein product [Cylicocyclus nassatus]|uniref:Uncharacterized protein n=1 Tax=Cylicocyclus nassatus TaxID=53992 RepID=A0AA36H349_CYLNA|nr:unnamed protein product [Cylicocyclus nassatus]